MTLVKVLNSGSDGNGYLIATENETLLLECGVYPKEMLDATHYNVRHIVGALVSHEHGDHAQYVKKYANYGFPIIASEEVSDRLYEKYGVTACRWKRNAVHKIGGFDIVPFRVPHNETECDGFLIKHTEFGRLLFITDLEYCPYDFSKMHINHVLVECNYSAEKVDMDDPNTAHVFRGHMELQTTKKFIRTILHPNLHTVGLIHLSGKNADPCAIKMEMEQEFIEQSFWIAYAGTEIYLGG